MAPGFSTDSPNGLTDEHKMVLTRLARASIEYGVSHGRPLPVEVEDFVPPLREDRATFVTLKIHGELRGCVGSILPQRPLVEDVSHNAYAAAFEDPRFPGMRREELPALDIHISVLTVPEALPIASESDLVEKIRPGIDGLILAEGFRKGTFLPSVWAQLPSPRDFIQHLKIKAGLPPDYWSDTISIERYSTEEW
jgi:AmmeMemoRadiSam system protein A